MRGCSPCLGQQHAPGKAPTAVASRSSPWHNSRARSHWQHLAGRQGSRGIFPAQRSSSRVSAQVSQDELKPDFSKSSVWDFYSEVREGRPAVWVRQGSMQLGARHEAKERDRNVPLQRNSAKAPPCACCPSALVPCCSHPDSTVSVLASSVQGRVTQHT